jgi:hypothetical protein
MNTRSRGKMSAGDASAGRAGSGVGTVGAVMAGVVVGGGVAVAQPWSAAEQFSATSNPSGVWSYGTRAAASPGTLNLLPSAFATDGFVGWNDPAFNDIGTPVVYKNTVNAVREVGSVTIPPLALVLHPGPVGFGPSREWAVVRFTVPAPARYKFTGAFGPADGGTTDVRIGVNGVEAFAGVRGFGQTVFYSVIRDLVAGDHVDFEVGPAGNFTFDSTTLDVQARAIVPCGPSDIAQPGPTVGFDGEVTADDVILFVSWFTSGDARADIARPGPTAGGDGEFTADDVILFVSRFTLGC